MQLGVNAAVGPPVVVATGARAVLAAALVAKTSVEEQQKFHDARQEWADDNLKPIKKAYDEAVQAQANLLG